MAEGYMGERVIPIEHTPYRDYDREDWALYYIEAYGGIDGDHHKSWVLDQVARILKGAEIEVKMAEWLHRGRYSYEWRVNVLEPTEEYHEWVRALKAGEDGPETYGYDIGVPP